MYRRMGPKELEKIIEENKKWNELSSGFATGVEQKTKPSKVGVNVQNVPNPVEVGHRTDSSNLDRP